MVGLSCDVDVGFPKKKRIVLTGCRGKWTIGKGSCEANWRSERGATSSSKEHGKQPEKKGCNIADIAESFTQQVNNMDPKKTWSGRLLRCWKWQSSSPVSCEPWKMLLSPGWFVVIPTVIILNKPGRITAIIHYYSQQTKINLNCLWSKTVCDGSVFRVYFINNQQRYSCFPIEHPDCPH